MKAGDIVVYDFYLLPCKAGVFVKDNLVLLAVLKEGQSISPVDELLSNLLGGGVTVKSVFSYHFNWAECNNGVTAPAVGPGIPARILPLLKHILLPLTAGLLVSHPSERTEEKKMDGCD